MAERAPSGSIASVFVKKGLLDADTIQAAGEAARANNQRLEHYLVEKKLVKASDVTLVLADYLKMTPISLSDFSLPEALLKKIPIDTMKKHMVVPIACIGKTMSVALGDPFDLMTVDELSTMTGCRIIPLVAGEEEVKQLITKLTTAGSKDLDMESLMRDESDVEVLEEEETEESLESQMESAEGAPVIRMVNMILVEALRTGASDIHIEPEEKKVRLRYRIDGKLVERPGPPKNLQNAVSSRIKIMSDLNIAERRVPQDGRTHIKAMGKEVDLRISILPTVHGEKIVIRTLDKSKLLGGVDNLGLDEVALRGFKFALDQPNGLILVTGPTGSGKTMTLYSCLQDLNQVDTNIITCEDPVEFQIEGLNQVQIKADVGLTFGAALRSILRQDPDVILVGELRDQETGHIAIEAALTGHLVLGTLHTNSAPQAVTRLTDMGIEPFMLGASLLLAQAQRLYRKLCSACKKPMEIDPEILKVNSIDPAFFEGHTIYGPGGCPRCSGGYKGRGAAMEVMLISEELRNAIMRAADAGELTRIACANGMRTLKQAGLYRVREGVTSIEAALEVTGSA